jgi:hypothetical protein
MRIRILLLIKVIQICDDWSPDNPRLHFEAQSSTASVNGTLKFYFECQTAPNFWFSDSLDPDPYYFSQRFKELQNQSSIRYWYLIKFNYLVIFLKYKIDTIFFSMALNMSRKDPYPYLINWPQRYWIRIRGSVINWPQISDPSIWITDPRILILKKYLRTRKTLLDSDF